MWIAAALCIVAAFAVSVASVATLRQSTSGVLPAKPALLGYLRDEIRRGRFAVDEPLRIGDRELRLPELRKRAADMVQIDPTARQLQFVRWKALDVRLGTTPHIELKHFKGSGWERVLSCAPANDRGVAVCRVLGHARAPNPPSGNLVRSIWTDAHAVELKEDRGPSYLAVRERDGLPFDCSIMLQDFPSHGFVVKAALDCFHRQRWPELAELLRAYLKDHLVTP